jgi:tRNA threonylcarbamoyladenosine biosynthesis protein TsaB
MILSIETSTTICSVALHDNGNLLANQDLFAEQSHSGMLTVMIDNILAQTKTTKQQLTAIAISDGPGSYTGLRIGASTAKGLCFALGIPLIAISTLQAIALQIANKLGGFLTNELGNKVLLCPMLDARRMEVYTALYNINLEIISPIEALVVDENSLSNLIETHTIICFGNGADKCKTVLKHSNFKFIDNISPSACTIGELAAKNTKTVDLIYYEPLYLKEYLAKIAAKKV